MITGFNTDVEYRGEVIHVQTEDKGKDNPIVESLVYRGGEILGARRTAYADIFDNATYDEKRMIKFMEDQHRDVIADVHRGQFHDGGVDLLAGDGPSDQSLDQVILNYLAAKEDND